MGDVLTFVEKAQEVMLQEDTEEIEKKIMSAKFDFNDFLKKTRAIARMGSISRVIGMIPGMGKVRSLFFGFLLEQGCLSFALLFVHFA
ncbi:hypothetical protein Dimus_012839 [Dionaea muscipula]